MFIEATRGTTVTRPTSKAVGSDEALTVALVDTNGDQVVSFGGGTQYTEDTAAAANPQGNATMLIRQDTPASKTTTDGDNVAQGGTDFGAGYVTILTSLGAVVDTFGGGTQYTEDAAAAANPTGTMPVFVRKDSPSATVTTDGDNVAQRGTDFGAGYVTILTSAGVAVDTFGGGTQYTEDAAAAGDPVGNASILVRKDTPASTVTTDGDNIAQRGTNFGAGYVTILTSAGAVVDTFGGGTQYAEGAVAATITGTALMWEDSGNVLAAVSAAKPLPILLDAAALAALETITVASVTAPLAAGTNNIGDVDVLTVPADPFGVNADAASATGSVSAKLRFIASTGIPITGTVTVGSHAVTNAGTFATQAAQSGTWTVQPGNTANSTAWLVTGTGGTFPVTDSGGSLTIDAPVGTPAFVRLSDGSAAITTLAVSLASVPSHAVTNAGTFAVQVDNTVTVASHAVTNAGTFAVQNTAATPAGSNNIGDVDVLTLPALVAGTANIGDVDVLTVPADPFGVNADAASATGSISAKLRFIAATGIPVTNTVTISGTVTANAGTNLNTSALALEAGGNLAAAATSLGTLDDWDSTDACKVVGSMAAVTVERTRPADTTAYAANDAVSDSTSSPTAITFADLGRVNGGTGYITGGVLLTDQTTNTARFRLNLYVGSSAPTATNDNSASTVTYANTGLFLGFIDFPACAMGGMAANNEIRIPFVCDAANDNIYGRLQTLDAFTPANAQKITITLKTDRN